MEVCVVFMKFFPSYTLDKILKKLTWLQFWGLMRTYIAIENKHKDEANKLAVRNQLLSNGPSAL